MDPVDARIVAALQYDARATYAQLAAIVGVSETTVLRRLQRLRSAGDIDVIGVLDSQRCGLGKPVLVQLLTEPGRTVSVAETVAARPDVRFLTIVSGRTNIICELIVHDRAHLAETLLHEIAGIEGILSTTTSAVLRTYKTRDEWSRELLPGGPLPAPTVGHGAGRKPKMDHLDMALISALAQDGRRSYVDLGNELELNETAVARRLGLLVAGRQLSFATLVDPAALGFEIEAILYLRVDLSTTETVATFLASRREVRYVSATAGYSDITCEAVFRDNDSLHDFMIHTLGSLKGVRELEVDLELQTIKRAFRSLAPPHPTDDTLANPVGENLATKPLA